MRTIIGAVSLTIIALNPGAFAIAQQSGPEFTSELPLDSCHFVPWGGSPNFRLSPGQQRRLSNERCVEAGECEEREEVWITVKRDTRRIPVDIDGRTRTVWTRVIEELESVDGLLSEVSKNFFATCWGTGDVYYFGQEVTLYDDGEIVGHDGAWLAGVAGARPGLMMPELYLLGARYFQKLAPGVALDRVEHVGSGLGVEVPAGEFHDCVRVDVTSLLTPGVTATKVYCPGIGLVVDGKLELTTFYD